MNHSDKKYLLWGLILPLWVILHHLFDDLFYPSILEYLRVHYNVSENNLIAVISQNIIPVLVVVVIISLLRVVLAQSKTNKIAGDIKRDWNLQDAYYWAKDQRGVDPENIFSTLKQGAADGNLKIWGRKNCSHLAPSIFEKCRVLEEIPKDHWKKYNFDVLRYIFEDDIERVRMASTPEAGVKTNDRFSDLHVSSDEIKSIWPHRKLSHIYLQQWLTKWCTKGIRH